MHSSVPTYIDLQFVGADLCDTSGSKFVSLQGTTNVVTLGTLLSGEDQGADDADASGSLIRTSGGRVRMKQLVGTGNIPTTATDATTAAIKLPVGKKHFHEIVTCTGTCVQRVKVYGASENSATVAKSVLVCDLYANASTTAVDWCDTDVSFLYWFAVTSATSGTTPLSALLIQD